MYAVISPEKIEIPPGSVFQMPGTWSEYETLSKQLGDRSIPRLKYRPGEIWFMSPLSEHGRNASLVADTIKAILDHIGKEYEAFTPITMRLPQRSGIEPDYCFYIDNWQAAAGKKRIDWTSEPAPDLVIEVDITSYTNVNDYLAYKVPEVWLFKSDEVWSWGSPPGTTSSRSDRLTIYRLQNDSYVESDRSGYFPELEILQLISECFIDAENRNTSAAIRQLRQKLNES